MKAPLKTQAATNTAKQKASDSFGNIGRVREIVQLLVKNEDDATAIVAGVSRWLLVFAKADNVSKTDLNRRIALIGNLADQLSVALADDLGAEAWHRIGHKFLDQMLACDASPKARAMLERKEPELASKLATATKARAMLERNAIFQHAPELASKFAIVARSAENARLGAGPLPDYEKQLLGLKLAHLWHALTGRHPTFSKSASFEIPGTKFGHFVKEVVLTLPDHSSFKTGFVDFLEKVVSLYGGGKTG